jgi:dGTPase
MARALDVLKHFVSTFVIQVPQVQIVEYKGQQIIMDIFEALTADPERLLPVHTKEQWCQAKSESNKMRVIADYISAMTDGHAQKLHRQLFSSIVL